MLVIILAGMITIYGIYYVSMITKVQEFGQLRAIGATKRQIRRIVLLEGMCTAAAANSGGTAFRNAACPGMCPDALWPCG